MCPHTQQTYSEMNLSHEFIPWLICACSSRGVLKMVFRVPEYHSQFRTHTQRLLKGPVIPLLLVWDFLARTGWIVSMYTCLVASRSVLLCPGQSFRWWSLGLKSESVFKTSQELVTFHWGSWPQPSALHWSIPEFFYLYIYIKQYPYWLLMGFPLQHHSLFIIYCHKVLWLLFQPFFPFSYHYGNCGHLASEFKSCWSASTTINCAYREQAQSAPRCPCPHQSITHCWSKWGVPSGPAQVHSQLSGLPGLRSRPQPHHACFPEPFDSIPRRLPWQGTRILSPRFCEISQ